eukprot:4842819-Amphidinium_carterae.1
MGKNLMTSTTRTLPSLHHDPLCTKSLNATPLKYWKLRAQICHLHSWWVCAPGKRRLSETDVEPDPPVRQVTTGVPFPQCSLRALASSAISAVARTVEAQFCVAKCDGGLQR